MSTKTIREALRGIYARGTADEVQQAQRAMAEVEAIEKAAKALEAESVGDFVYEVRGRAASDAAFTGNTWEHPRVVAYGEAAQVITSIAKESK